MLISKVETDIDKDSRDEDSNDDDDRIFFNLNKVFNFLNEIDFNCLSI